SAILPHAQSCSSNVRACLGPFSPPDDMFDNLIETKARKQRRAGGVTFSIVLHAVLIGSAGYFTCRAHQNFEKPKEEKVAFVEVKKPPPPPKELPKPPPDMVVAPPPPKG